MTAAQARQTFEEQKRKHLVDADGHDREIAKAEKRLGEIKTSRERRDHLERVLARDAGAVKADEKLAQEQSTLEREVSTRKGLAADSRRSVESLAPRIADATFFEAVDQARSQGARVRKFTEDSSPVFASFSELIEKLYGEGAALAAALKSLPDPAPRWLSRTIDALPKLFGDGIMREVGEALRNIGFLHAGPRNREQYSFQDVVDQFFVRLEKALATIMATRSNGGPGRKMYRTVQAIGGLSGGLHVQHNEVIALLSDDQETQKLFQDGVIEQVTQEAA
jgi:hypothetical protein